MAPILQPPVLNHHSLSFKNEKTTASLCMHFCPVNTTKVVQSCSKLPHQNGANLNNERISG